MRINLLDCFIETVSKRPDSIAVSHNENSVTFGELKALAERLSVAINRSIGNKISSPIALFMPKNIGAVASNIAIMYSGNPFMNLDVMTPDDRIHNILNLVKPCLVITLLEYKKRFCDIDIPVIYYEEAVKAESENNFANLNYNAIIDTDPFCLINTSGSTGTPKSVVLNHKSFFDFLDWSYETFGFDGSEIIGSLSPLVFDIYVFELCLLMTKGSRIEIFDSSLATFPIRLIEKLEKTKVSFIFWVPTIMVNIANMNLLKGHKLSELKLIWFAGEVFPTKQFLYWYDKLKDAIFVNMYGPIEITLDCTFYKVLKRPDENRPLPIGIPCRNTDILLLNDGDEICQPGEDGELCVRGSSLAMGYYNNPEKTMAAFTQNPLQSCYPELIYRTGDIVYKCPDDGLLYIKGRKDSMIKHNGYRIELAEIEHITVNSLKIANNCCVVYDKNKRRIVMYYESENDISKADFRKQLSEKLPKYMIPNEFLRMKELLRNTNGKIDRNGLQCMLDEIIPD